MQPFLIFVFLQVLSVNAFKCTNRKFVSTRTSNVQMGNFLQETAIVKNVYNSISSQITSIRLSKAVEAVPNFLATLPANIKMIGASGLLALLLILVRKSLWTPSRTYDKIKNSVAEAYDAWQADGILEAYWGEHIHLGYYNEEERAKGYRKKNFIQAKFDFIDRMMEFGGISKPTYPIKVLDVGCGIGGTSRYLAKKLGTDADVTGITISPNQIARATALAAEQGVSNAHFELVDALNMRYPDNTFDVVWACESGEHMEDKKKYIEEMTRVLKPGGKMVVATWCQRDEGGKPFNAEERKMLDFLYAEWSHPYFISISDYVKLMDGTGSLKQVTSADWTEATIPSWRHSIWVGVENPIPVLMKPLLWWKCVRDGVTLERMHRSFKSGLMQYGMMAATKLNRYVPPAP